jgi:hypothetical protein
MFAELGGILKEEGPDLIELLSRHLPGRTDEKIEKLSRFPVSFPEIRTGYLASTSIHQASLCQINL